MERRRVGGSYADDSFARVPILVAGPMLAADKLPGALCALTVFGTALWRPRFALVAAFPAFLLTSALGMSTVFLVGVPLVAAMVTAFVAGELRIDGRRHLALAGFALWMAGSVLTIPAAPFLQTSRLSDAVTLVLGDPPRPRSSLPVCFSERTRPTWTADRRHSDWAPTPWAS
jgi:hypothetical protein